MHRSRVVPIVLLACLLAVTVASYPRAAAHAGCTSPTDPNPCPPGEKKKRPTATSAPTRTPTPEPTSTSTPIPTSTTVTVGAIPPVAPAGSSPEPRAGGGNTNLPWFLGGGGLLLVGLLLGIGIGRLRKAGGSDSHQDGWSAPGPPDHSIGNPDFLAGSTDSHQDGWVAPGPPDRSIGNPDLMTTQPGGNNAPQPQDVEGAQPHMSQNAADGFVKLEGQGPVGS